MVRAIMVNTFCIIAGGTVFILAITGVLNQWGFLSDSISILSLLGLAAVSIGVAKLSINWTLAAEQKGDEQAAVILNGFTFDKDGRRYGPANTTIVATLSTGQRVPNAYRGIRHTATHLGMTRNRQWFVVRSVWLIDGADLIETHVQFISTVEAERLLKGYAANTDVSGQTHLA